MARRELRKLKMVISIFSIVFLTILSFNRILRNRTMKMQKHPTYITEVTQGKI